MLSAVGVTRSGSCEMLSMLCLLPRLLNELCVLLSSSAQLLQLTQLTLVHVRIHVDSVNVMHHSYSPL